MAQKIIYDVEVNAKEFEKFASMFDKYQDALADTPDDWKKVAAAQEAVAKASDKLNSSFKSQTDNLRDQSAPEVEQLRRTRDSESLWAAMSRHSADMRKNWSAIGTDILKYGSVIGGGLLFGAAFGLDKLVGKIADARYNAMGLGSSVGSMQAFNVNLGRVTDTQGFLSNVGEMETDVSNRGAWNYMTGGAQMTGDATKDALKFLEGIRQFARTTPTELLTPIAEWVGLKTDSATLRRMQVMGDDEFNKLTTGVEKDSKDGIGDRGAQAYQNLQTEWERVSIQLLNRFASALTPLVPGLERLSGAVAGAIEHFLGTKGVKTAIDDLSGWLEKLAHGVESDAFKKKIDELLGATGEITEAFKDLASILGLLRKSHEGWEEIKLEWGKSDESWGQLFAPVTDYLANHFSFKDTKQAKLAAIDQQYQLPPGTLEYMLDHHPKAWDEAGGVGPMGIPKNLLLPGMDQNDLDQEGKLTAMLVQQHTVPGEGIERAMAQLYVGDQGVDALHKANPNEDWLPHMPDDFQQYMQGLRNQSLAIQTPLDTVPTDTGSIGKILTGARPATPRYSNANAQTAYAPQGTGVRITVEKMANTDMNVAFSQLA